MAKYTDYDNFARAYNKHWGEFPLRILPVLEKLVLNDFPRGARILDICCGTGQLAAELSKRGYEVTGVDSSDDMLKYARANAPTTAFIPADVRQFMLMARFNVAFSTFDSLNHLMTIEDLEQVFANVFRQLETNGVFVFDMNVEEGFLQRWIGSFNIIEDDMVIIVNSNYKQEEKIAKAHITLFNQEEEHWSRTNVELTQRAYTVQQLLETLASVGFIRLEVFDAAQDFNMTQQVGRVFIRAKKR